MAYMNYRFIGHCFDPKENHDKVWGAIFLGEPGVWGTRVLTFWGRRGKKLQTKLAQDDWCMTKLINTKVNNGYVEIDADRLDKVYPEFEADLEKTAMWAMLKL
jgi:predicted DNA-binding WGR domain protein